MANNTECFTDIGSNILRQYLYALLRQSWRFVCYVGKFTDAYVTLRRLLTLYEMLLWESAGCHVWRFLDLRWRSCGFEFLTDIAYVVLYCVGFVRSRVHRNAEIYLAY